MRQNLRSNVRTNPGTSPRLVSDQDGPRERLIFGEATKQHFRIGPTARSKVSGREICLYYHGHTQDMGDAPLADMLLSKVGSMGAAPKRIGCPGLVGVQASNWVVKFVLSGGRSCHPPASPPPGGRQPPGSQGIRGRGSFPSVWAEAEEISGDSIL